MRNQTFLIVILCAVAFFQLHGADSLPHPILTISGSGSGANTVTNVPESTYTNNFTPRTPPRNEGDGFAPAVVSGDTGWSWSSSSPTQIVSTPSGTIFPNTNTATYPVRTQVVQVFLTTATNNLIRPVNALYYNKAGSTTSKSFVLNVIDMHKRDTLRGDFNKLAPAYINSGGSPATRNDNYARRLAVSLLDWARWHPLYYLTAINSPTLIDVTTNYLATTGGFGPQRASDHNGLAHEWQVEELKAFDAIYSSVVLTNLNAEMGFDVRQYICDNLFFDEGDFLINHIPISIAIQSNLSGPYAILPEVARVLDRPDYIIWMDVYLDATVRQKIRRDGALEEGEGYSIGYLNSNQDAAQNTSDYFLTRIATNSLLYAISNRAKIYNTSLTYGQGQWATVALPNGQLPSFGDTPFNTYFTARNNGNSAVLPAYGTLSLGSGSSSSTAVQVNQNFSGDNNHMRADMNAFVLWAFNNEYLGNIRYYNGSVGRNFGEQMLAYNTIEIDRSNLTPYTDADTSGNGNLDIYEAGNNGLAMTEIDGQRAYSSKASRFQRLLLLNTVDQSKPYVVDVFRVTGGTTHDYLFHGSVRWTQSGQASFPLVTNNALYPMLEGSETWDPSSDTPYYGFWRGVNSNAVPGNFYLTFTDTNRSTARDTRYWVTADPNLYNLYLGWTPVPARDDTVPTNFFNNLNLKRPSAIIRHRLASGTLQDLFVSVVEPFNVGVSNIVSVQRLPMASTNESVGLRVTFKDGRVDTYIVNLRNLRVAGASGGSPTVSTVDGLYSLTGRVGLHVDRPSADSRVWTVNATDFRYPNRELVSPTNIYYSGWIAGETRRLYGDTYDAFYTTAALPTGTVLRNKWLSFTHGSLSSTTNISEMFKIDQVVLTNGFYHICFTNDHMLEITNGVTSREQVAPLRTFTTSNWFEIVLTAYAGQVSAIADQNIAPGGSSAPLPFNFGALGTTAATNLQIVAVSSNQVLVPNGNLVIGGSGTNRTLTVTPAAAQTGTSLITVSTTDGIWTNSRTFLVSVGNYALVTSPSSRSVLAGNSASYTNQLTATNGSGSAGFSISGVPAGATANFVPSTFTDSGTNTLTVTTSTNTPPGTYPLSITATEGAHTATNVVTLVVTTLAAQPGTLYWVGTNDWSTILNWTNLVAGGNGPPGISNDVVFAGFATVATSNNVNNAVNANFAISSLTYNQTNAWHTTRIQPGNTLTILGSKGLLVGTESDQSSNAVVTGTITGAGTLVISNAAASVLVRQYIGTTSFNTHRAILDLSGLDTFNMTGSQIEVGMWGGGGTIRSAGTMLLARTNLLNLLIPAKGGTTNAGIDVADNPSANSSQFSYFYLGQQNTVYADGITVGGGRNIGWLGFNPNFTDSTLFIRGTNGDTSRVARWLVGDNSGASSTGSNSRGTNDLTGGTVDALVDTMILGRGEGPNMGSGTSTGVVLFASGVIDVNSLQMGVHTAGATGGTNSGTIGTNYVGQIDVDGNANLVVNNSLLMTVTNGGIVGAMNLVASLNINGGTVQSANTVGGSGTSIINLNSGTMDVQGGRITNVTTLNIGDGISGAAQLINAAKITSPNAITLAANGTLSGNILLTAPDLAAGGAISPGDTAIGAITNSGNITFKNGGSYVVDMMAAGAVLTNGWDFLFAGGSFNVQAANTNPFTVQLRSIDGDQNDGSPGAADFNNGTAQAWVIASAAGGVTNFVADKFTVDNSAFLNDLAGGYFVVGTNDTSLLLSFIPNNPPSANDVTFYLPPSGSLQVPLASLSSQWSDPNGDPVQFAGAEPDSANGTNNVSNDSTYIYYTGTPGVADTVFYSVADLRTNPPAIYRPGDTQRTTTGIIHILPPPTIAAIAINGANLVFSGANGAPGSTYYVLASTNLSLPLNQWPVIATNAFDLDGDFSFTNTPPAGVPQTFYTLRLP